MAIGWWTVLTQVPWGEVIKSAPVVADGAKRLWESAARKPKAAPDFASSPHDLAAGVPALADPALLQALQARLEGAEAATAQLQAQMQASSALIKALAEQNAELVQRVEVNRVRTVWLLGVVLALCLGCAAMAGRIWL